MRTTIPMFVQTWRTYSIESYQKRLLIATHRTYLVLPLLPLFSFLLPLKFLSVLSSSPLSLFSSPHPLPSFFFHREGSDDMPAHVKSSLFGASLTIPVTDGKLALGTWQGVWLCEHRDRASSRTIIVTIQGESSR
jgi:hypothetical protein